MSIETDANRLAMLKAVGAEQFDTGQTDSLWAVFDNEFQEVEAAGHLVERRIPYLECRSSDVSAHDLVKESVIRRQSDDVQYRVRRIEPDGTGMTRIQLKS